MRVLALALLLVATPAWAGPKKSKQPPPAPPPAAETAPAAPAIDPAFEADIQKLLVLTGSAEIGQQTLDQMLAAMRPMAPQIPESVWQDLRNEMKVEDLLALLVPVYAKHLTHEDVLGLIAFYESPAGRKFVSVQGAINQEAMAVGQVWGEQAAGRVIARLQAEGLK